MRARELLRAALLLEAISVVAVAQGTVNSESLKVFSRMDSASDVVKTLKKGDAVVIEMSIQGEDGAEWCSIREPEQKNRLGYVRCQFLNRPPQPKSSPVASSASASLPATPAPSDDALDLSRLTTLGQQRYLGWAMVIAKDFDFSAQQKACVLPLARQTGILNCVEDTDRHVRQGQMPPDLLTNRNSPVTQCDWSFQAFLEQIFALVTPEQQAAHRATYDDWKRQITGGRPLLEQRSRER